MSEIKTKQTEIIKATLKGYSTIKVKVQSILLDWGILRYEQIYIELRKIHRQKRQSSSTCDQKNSCVCRYCGLAMD